MTATGKWTEPGVPHKGWTCIGIEDLGEPSFTCEMCEVMIIRYVHTMAHPEHSTLKCGCICAGHMEEDILGAQKREAVFKTSRTRRAHWLQRRWHQGMHHAKGDWHLSEYVNADGFNIAVWQEDGSWHGRIYHRATGRERLSRLFYPTRDRIKLAAFDAMIGMKARL